MLGTTVDTCSRQSESFCMISTHFLREGDFHVETWTLFL